MKTLLLCALFCQLAPLANAQAPARPRPSPWSAGLFLRSDSMPYKGSDSDISVLPYASYRGERLEWFGPLLRWKLTTLAGWNLALHGIVDFPAYEEDDAAILQGMGDRDYTFLLGLDASRELLPDLHLVLSTDSDLLGRHDGNLSSIALVRNIGHPRNPISGDLSLGIHLQDDNWTSYVVGVPESKSRPDRPAYDPGNSIHPFVGGRVLWRFAPPWSAMLLVRCEFLDETWRDSPLIGEDYRLTSMLNIAYSF